MRYITLRNPDTHIIEIYTAEDEHDERIVKAMDKGFIEVIGNIDFDLIKNAGRR